LVGKERDARTFFLKVDAILEKLGQKPAKNGNSLKLSYGQANKYRRSGEAPKTTIPVKNNFCFPPPLKP